MHRNRVCVVALLLAGTARAQPPITFKAAGITVDSGILQVLATDVNSDGNTDLVFLTSANLDVLLGNGDGTFKAPIQTTALAYSTIVADDFNGDGKIDVVALGIQGQTTFIDTFPGNGDGTFSPRVRSPVPSPYPSTQGVPAVGDVNGDGVLDLIGPGVIALGAGDGTFSRTITACANTPGLAGSVSDAVAATFRGDGNVDLALAASEMSGGGLFQLEIASAVACFGNGAGTFSSGPVIFNNSGLSLSDSPVSYLAATGDFNGDGNADVLIVSQYAPDQPPSVFGYSVIFGNGNGGFQPALTDGPYTSSVPAGNLYLLKPAVVDMNGDGKSDLVQIGGQGITIFLSNGDGTFTSAVSLAPAQNPVSIAVADFNHDGLPDIVSTGSSQTTLLINTSFRIDSVVNAATLAAGPVAPGSLVAIEGAGLGPVNGLSTTSTPWPDSLGGVSVAFNGIAAPLSYVSSQQINAQAPWEISGSASVVVTVNGSSTAAFTVNTASIAPGVFALPSGQAFAFNLDGSFAGPPGTISGLPSHPASDGDTIVVYANGLGPVTPPIADGAASADQLRNAGVTPVFIGKAGCDVLFAGLSPALVGVDQINVVIPSGVHGIVPLQINAGGVLTSSQVTITVQ